MQHVGSSSLTRDPTPSPLHQEHGVLATGPHRSPMENGILWGRSGYNQRPRKLPRPCSLTDVPRPACHQVPLLLPPNPLASAPSSPCPVVPFVQTQHFSGELTSLAFSLSLRLCQHDLTEHKAGREAPRSWWFLACALRDSPLYPLYGRHTAPRARPASSALCTVPCSSLAAGLLPLCSSGKLLFILMVSSVSLLCVPRQSGSLHLFKQLWPRPPCHIVLHVNYCHAYPFTGL